MRLALVALLAVASFGCTTFRDAPLVLDTLIVNGRVYTGDSHRPVKTALGITGDKIVFIGNEKTAAVRAARVIDAGGNIVVPGFIDVHTHTLSDFTDLRSEVRNANLPYLMQGVTTVFNGNDGGGPIRTGDLLQSLNKRGIGTNTALFIGHGAVRRQVMGAVDEKPDASQLQQMKVLVAEAMEQGALGLSTGLYYVPGSFADTDEVVELAKVAAAHGGIYESHIRDESSYTIGLVGAVEEALEIGRRANIPVHIAHIKALGMDVWGQSREVISRIEQARANGQQVTADQYPWSASGTKLRNALVPRTVMAGGTEAFYARLKNPQQLPEIKAAMAENLRRRGGAGSILIVAAAKEQWPGKTLADIANQSDADAIATAIDIILTGPTSIASFNMNEKDIERFMRQPWVMSSSDGTNGHPRKYASYPRKYREYVKGKKVIPEADFVYRSSGMVADIFGIDRRGYLRTGYFADIAIIDFERYRPAADFRHWNRLSEGVVTVLVNGKVVIDNGKFTGELAGKALSRAKHSREKQRQN